MSRIYSALAFVSLQAFLIGITLGYAIAGKHISAPILIAQFALAVLVVRINIDGIKRRVSKL